jgi:iron complex outermembrane receptor protein
MLEIELMKATGPLFIAMTTAAAMWPMYAGAASSDDNTLAEIVVTAQKRLEDVDKVPISISVFNRATMEQRGIQDLSDIAAISPGVDYQNLGGMNRVTIRGITTGTSQAGYATTGLYIDDIPIQVRPSTQIDLYGTADPKVFDLDRVEVLRGPQGTLFGAGAEGGAIRFITVPVSPMAEAPITRPVRRTEDLSYRTNWAFASAPGIGWMAAIFNTTALWGATTIQTETGRTAP